MATKRKQKTPISKTKSLSSSQKTKQRRANIPKASTKNVRRKASYRFTAKRTAQQTATLARETLIVKSTRGSKLVSNFDNAKSILLKKASDAKKKFSRKKSSRYVVGIKVKYKNIKGKWVSRTFKHVSASLEEAIDNLLEEKELYDDVSTGIDKEGQTTSRGIKSATKRIAGVSFSKYVKRARKIPKATKRKGKKKKSRGIRHRK